MKILGLTGINNKTNYINFDLVNGFYQDTTYGSGKITKILTNKWVFEVTETPEEIAKELNK